MRPLVRFLTFVFLVTVGAAHCRAAGASLSEGVPCWSEPQDPDGVLLVSYEVSWVGLHSEIANDFQVTGDMITKAIWWGGFWGNNFPCESGVVTAGFHIRLYSDADCAPGEIVADLDVTDFTEESAGCQGPFPLFKWTADLSIPVVPTATYWYSAEMMDYGRIEPMSGRLPAFVTTGCESQFKSAYFGFPDWVPCRNVVGVDWDASQALECEVETAVQRTTWGAIRAWYR